MEQRNILDKRIEKAIDLAEKIQKIANEIATSEDRIIQKRMISFLNNPADKVLFTQLVDQGLRPVNKYRVAERIAFLLKKGIPGFLSKAERLLALLYIMLGRFLPFISVPVIMKKLQRETENLVLPGEEKKLFRHLEKRHEQGVMININHLGEAVLGEEEALARLDDYIEDLKKPEITHISVKSSGIMSQIQPIAFEYNVSVLKKRLMLLYRTAKKYKKFVNLDMEDYKFLDATALAFIQAIDQNEFKDLSAGIALQAYLPDSFMWQQKITGLAQKRVSIGGAPLRIRLVKGACLEMEKIESGLKVWPLPIYREKKETDANYKRMVEYGMIPENIKAVKLGIASHNLFDLAYAIVLAEEKNIPEHVTIEMLEGMADHVRKALGLIMGKNIGMLLYAPVVEKENFINAMAYLVRRMDENTAEENFMRHSFGLRTGTEKWEFLKGQFVESLNIKDNVASKPYRSQNRQNEEYKNTGSFETGKFSSEPDTDWSLEANRIWASRIKEKWVDGGGLYPVEIPIVVENEEIFKDRAKEGVIDKSRAKDNIVVAKFALAEERDIERAVKTARSDPEGWGELSKEKRHEIISEVAKEIRKARGDLIGAMAANTGKVFTEADIEVSEAVDFAEYYPYSMKALDELNGIEHKCKGVALVIPPWNFPVAIPAGGMLAALASGNRVIIKSSSEAVLAAWVLCSCFWRGGVTRNTLQFLPCRGTEAGALLAAHSGIDFIIFTGGTDTALNILSRRPDINIAAETGGKNATIVTVMADYDQAVNNVIHSAFSNCGQKCSATSLLVLERDVFNDEGFKRKLVDAVKSYSAGSAWDLKNRMGPLIKPPALDLYRAFTELAPGESWLVEPGNIDGSPYIWRPCVKWNVKPGSYCHMTEFFGPMLSVMCAGDLNDAIKIVNSTGYGLTSGLESLDEREHEVWKAGIKAGNLYINRVTTGAVVLRQPFGGMGKSAIGSGIKAGGPNYVLQFMDYRETGSPSSGIITGDYHLSRIANRWTGMLYKKEWSDFRPDIEKAIEAVKSYLYNYEQEFSKERDFFKLRGQDNIFRYLPSGPVAVRIHEEDSLFSVLARTAAAGIAGCPLVLSVPGDLTNKVISFIKTKDFSEWLGQGKIIFQSDDELIQMMPSLALIRYSSAAAVPGRIYEAAARTGFYISRAPVLSEGRIELLQYFREQSISHDYHRYGNLGMRDL